ncbi:DUF6326 family protein [Pedobacter sp. Du54]|uniref:DUF6326 family protein n=1 Tax=Pedobacter anseongensis TaxID=3133439 RepID=UPI0030B26319
MNPTSTRKHQFEDFNINVKVKLAALWASLMSCYIYGDYFSLYVPHKIEKFIAGNTLLDSPLKLFSAAVLLAIPAVMICLSVLLKPLLNRWLNIIFGIFYSILMLLIAITTLSVWWSFYVFLAVLEVIISSLIVWHAYNWPKINH